MRQLIVAAVAATLLAAPFTAQAQEGGRSAAERNRNAVAEDIEKNWARASAEEREVTTSHSITAHGKRLNYKATAGTLTVRNDGGMPTASLFYVAYTLDGQPLGSRPITYMFNGGPGSPSIWLHMGAFGPVRVLTDDPVVERPAPFRMGPNDMTLLDKTDLVFIDMVGAGYSRPLGDTPGSAHWGVDQDVDTFARAILRYTTKFNRWSSPKFILGESYGTLRAGALSYQLENRGMSLNGVILLSSIMNYGVRQAGYPQNFVTLLPTYAATAWYHNAVNREGVTLEQHVERARQFAIGPYYSALNKGHLISDQERAAVAREMSQLVGLSPEFIEQANLRVELSPFRKELLRDRRQTVGRLDSRYTGIDYSHVTGSPEEDPSSSAITGHYFGVFRDYIASTLKYETDLDYRQSARGLPGFDWDWSHRSPLGGVQTTPNTAVDLAAVIRRNPHVKVLALNGYYDAATPFFSTEYDLAQMMLEPHLRNNVQFTYYEAGHMMYTSREPLEKLYRDMAAYYDETSNGGLR
ncbi:S10 family serine carboxypeptidase-like protein [Brevundimonas sp.]|uniref:S10 family peptidase n=1 Tax=Brevundimonas sp. TaxID=1871086 RepID=UPI00289EA1E6|nr:peptidase S10 [Brevundimonas sp.]